MFFEARAGSKSTGLQFIVLYSSAYIAMYSRSTYMPFSCVGITRRKRYINTPREDVIQC